MGQICRPIRPATDLSGRLPLALARWRLYPRGSAYLAAPIRLGRLRRRKSTVQLAWELLRRKQIDFRSGAARAISHLRPATSRTRIMASDMRILERSDRLVSSGQPTRVHYRTCDQLAIEISLTATSLMDCSGRPTIRWLRPVLAIKVEGAVECRRGAHLSSRCRSPRASGRGPVVVVVGGRQAAGS